MRASGLAAPAAIARDVPVEQVADAAALQIRIAVAQREQPIARAQSLERRTHVVEELDAVARGEEHLERFLARGLGVTGGFGIALRARAGART